MGVGLVIGIFMYPRLIKMKFIKKFLGKGSNRDRVLNDPEGEMKGQYYTGKGEGFVNDGQKMKYSVVEKDGEKVVRLEESNPTKPKGTKITKKTANPKKSIRAKSPKQKGLKRR